MCIWCILNNILIIIIQKFLRIFFKFVSIFKKKNLPLQDRQQKHVSCTALVMNNTCRVN